MREQTAGGPCAGFLQRQQRPWRRRVHAHRAGNPRLPATHPRPGSVPTEPQRHSRAIAAQAGRSLYPTSRKPPGNGYSSGIRLRVAVTVAMVRHGTAAEATTRGIVAPPCVVGHLRTSLIAASLAWAPELPRNHGWRSASGTSSWPAAMEARCRHVEVCTACRPVVNAATGRDVVPRPQPAMPADRRCTLPCWSKARALAASGSNSRGYRPAGIRGPGRQLGVGT